MRLLLTVAVLAALVFLAHRFGGKPERQVANILGASLFLGVLNRAIIGQFDFLYVDPVMAAVDTSVLIALVWIALWANRLWPIGMAALQLVVVLAHIPVLMQVDGKNVVYWAMMAVPQYLQFAVLGCAIACHRRRTRMGSRADDRAG